MGWGTWFISVYPCSACRTMAVDLLCMLASKAMNELVISLLVAWAILSAWPASLPSNARNKEIVHTVAFEEVSCMHSKGG